MKHYLSLSVSLAALTIALPAIAQSITLTFPSQTTEVPGLVDFPDCDDTAGQHLNFDSATGSFTCGTSGDGSGTPANQPANTLFGNPTGSTAAPTNIPLGAGLSFSGGALTSSGGLTLGGSDGQIIYRSNSSTLSGVTVGTGLNMAGGTLSLTSALNNQSTGAYAVLTGDKSKSVLVGPHTYTMPDAGTPGFEDGWQTCLLNTGGNYSTIEAATSVFLGAGSNNVMYLTEGMYACFTSTNGNYATFWGGPAAAAGVHGDIQINEAGVIAARAPSGNGATIVTTTGAQTSGRCVQIDANGNHIAAAAACGSGGGGGLDLSGVTNGALLYDNADAVGAVTLGTGLQMAAGTLSLTTVVNDQDAGNYTIVTGDAAKSVLVGAFTYTLPQAGSTGFGTGWSACFVNTGTANATMNTTTSVFLGAGGATSLTIFPGDVVCPSSDGTNWVTAVTRRAPEMHLPIGWVAGVDPNATIIFTAPRAMRVTDIRGTVATPVGSAATVAVYKAPSGTACGSGTIQHSSTFNANGTANTNQTLTLANTSANDLAVNDRLCLVTTGGAAWTGGSGNAGITVTARAL